VNGWRIARVGGIPIRIDPTFFLIALLIGSSIYTSEVNTLRFPPLTTAQAFSLALFGIVLFFLSILLHELAHAGMSRARDIPVSGISIYMLGGATFTALEERGPADEFLITVVGPATSALLGVLFLFVHRVGTLPGPIDDVVHQMGTWNLLVAGFNVLPMYPLDGGRLLRSAIWKGVGARARATAITARVSQAFTVAVIGYAAYRFLVGHDTRWVWFGLIAVFLFVEASRALRQERYALAIGSARAADVMSAPPPAVPSEMTVGEATTRFLDGHEGEAFPVLANGTIAGFVSLTTVRGVDLDRPVLEASVAPTAVATVAPNEALAEVVSKLRQEHVAAALVMDQGSLVGVIEVRDVNRFLETRA
jgi:Zn-dependent protease/predicted transcriptional regulator